MPASIRVRSLACETLHTNMTFSKKKRNVVAQPTDTTPNTTPSSTVDNASLKPVNIPVPDKSDSTLLGLLVEVQEMIYKFLIPPWLPKHPKHRTTIHIYPCPEPLRPLWPRGDMRWDVSQVGGKKIWPRQDHPGREDIIRKAGMILSQAPIPSHIRARMALMRVNRQIYEEFADTLYAHATFEFEFGRGENERWRDAGADLVETALTGRMAWKMQACHIILNSDTREL